MQHGACAGVGLQETALLGHHPAWAEGGTLERAKSHASALATALPAQPAGLPATCSPHLGFRVSISQRPCNTHFCRPRSSLLTAAICTTPEAQVPTGSSMCCLSRSNTAAGNMPKREASQVHSLVRLFASHESIGLGSGVGMGGGGTC